MNRHSFSTFKRNDGVRGVFDVFWCALWIRRRTTEKKREKKRKRKKKDSGLSLPSTYPFVHPGGTTWFGTPGMTGAAMAALERLINRAGVVQLWADAAFTHVARRGGRDRTSAVNDTLPHAAATLLLSSAAVGSRSRLAHRERKGRAGRWRTIFSLLPATRWQWCESPRRGRQTDTCSIPTPRHHTTRLDSPGRVHYDRAVAPLP